MKVTHKPPATRPVKFDVVIDCKHAYEMVCELYSCWKLQTRRSCL